MAPATGIVFNRIGTVYLLAAALLSSGYLAGFNGALLSLSREGQFRELCTSGTGSSSSPSVPFGASLTCISSLIVTPDRCAQSECDAQSDSINSVVHVLLIGAAFAYLITGTALDLLSSSRYICVFSHMSIFLGLILLSFADSLIVNTFQAGSFFVGFGCAGIVMVCFSTAVRLAPTRAVLFMLVVMCIEVSTYFPPLMYLLHSGDVASRIHVFAVQAAVQGLLAVVALFVDFSAAASESSILELAEFDKPKYALINSHSTTAGGALIRYFLVKSHIESSVVPHRNSLSDLVRNSLDKMAPFMSALIVHVFFESFYVGTIGLQLKLISDDNTLYRRFAVMYTSVTLAVSPLAALFMARLRHGWTLFATNLFAIISGALLLAQNISLQFLGFLLFAVSRQIVLGGSFAFAYSFAGPAYFGRLIGACWCCATLVSLGSFRLAAAASKASPRGYLTSDVALMLAIASVFVVLCCRCGQHSKRPVAQQVSGQEADAIPAVEFAGVVNDKHDEMDVRA